MKYVKKHMVMEQLMEQKRGFDTKRKDRKAIGHPQADPF